MRFLRSFLGLGRGFRSCSPKPLPRWILTVVFLVLLLGVSGCKTPEARKKKSGYFRPMSFREASFQERTRRQSSRPPKLRGKTLVDCKKTHKSDFMCLMCNLLGEAKNQASKGRILVNISVYKRVQSRHYPSTVCQVVYETRKRRGSRSRTAMYSWTKKRRNYFLSRDKYRALEKSVLLAMTTHQEYPCYTHYHNPRLSRPSWGTGGSRPISRRAVNVGAHRFYNTSLCKGGRRHVASKRRSASA